jgi:lysophospholipase L1-like esterase
MKWLVVAFSAMAAVPVHAADSLDDGPIRVACVGDSITFGSGVEEREKNSYPAVLGRLLGQKYKVRNFGVSGATLQKRGDKPYWTLDAMKDVSEFQPHVVVVKLGTNDSKPQNWHGVEPYKIDLVALITHFRALPDEPQIFVCTPAPVFKDAFRIREAVVRDEIVPAVKDVAKQTETPLIDLHSALGEAEDVFPDGVHPNAAGAKKIAEAVSKALREHSAVGAGAAERSSGS